ncbi:MAG TPA: T9SS type A sorting domain-containing protein, partial [Bacteroidia bacterium]|nr:T9SS type A sorting domain-containing protein [Bacteroidia bacterium]
TNVFGGYVVKYTPSGTPVWVKGIDGWLGGTSVAAGPNQNVVVTGGFETDTATFDSFSLINACQTCNNTDIFVLSLNSLPTGIKENASVNKMNVYPVPTRDRLIVSFTEELKDATLDVLDILGNQLRTVRFSGKEYILEKDNLPPGVYIIRVTAEGEVLRRQVVIQ